MSPRPLKPVIATLKQITAKTAERITLIFIEIFKAAPGDELHGRSGSHCRGAPIIWLAR